MPSNTAIPAPNPFTFSPSLTSYNIPPTAYLSANPNLSGLIVSAVILHRDTNRVLLIQRASHDGFPLRWETPGGGADTTDATILHAVCREAFEETGLVVRHVAELVETIDFEGREGDRWRKMTFLVSLDREREGEGHRMPAVRLNPEEHCDAVWAGEGDVLEGRCDGRVIEFAYETQRSVVLGGLRRATGRRGEESQDKVSA